MNKEYILKFVNEAQACDVLIPKGFGYNSISRGPVLFDNSMGQFFLEKIASTEGFVIKLTVLNNTPELEEYLTPYLEV